MSTTADRVREAGIVGAGGAGFPTHVKFGSRAEVAIANGAECEPLLRCDKATMRERTDSVLHGLSLLAQATGAARAVIALKGHYRDVVARVREAAGSRFPGVEVFELEDYYPAGDEQQLVYLITGRVVPEGAIPLAVGAVIDNVITLAQVHGAVAHGRPVTRRALTVCGDVARPLTCELPIGTSMRLAVELAGGPTVADPVYLEGGPMMGRVVEHPDEPITKKTSGVLVLARSHPLAQRKLASDERELRLARAVCCQCRLCTDLCPRYNLGHALEPHLAMRTLRSYRPGELPAAAITQAWLCCLCGVCGLFACPLHLSPRKVFARLRAELAAAGVANPHARTGCEPDPFVDTRRVPLRRLVARLGLTGYLGAPDLVRWEAPEVVSVRILMSQHVGAPSVPAVRKGDRVVEGQCVAEPPDGKLGARQHASIPGRVTGVDDRAITIERT